MRFPKIQRSVAVRLSKVDCLDDLRRNGGAPADKQRKQALLRPKIFGNFFDAGMNSQLPHPEKFLSADVSESAPICIITYSV